MHLEDDLAIWKRIEKGDSKAFDTLFTQYFNFLYKYGFSLTIRESLIKDAIQDVFLEFWNNRKKIKINNSVKYYLLQSFRRSLISKIKEESPVSFEDQNPEQWVSESIENTILEKESTQQLQFKLTSMNILLTPRQREAIFLKFYQGMDSEEIAQLMQIDIKAVYKLISTGIMRYRKNLKKN